MAAFSLGDQPLVDLVRSGFSGGEAAGAVSFDEHHPYLNQQRPNYNAVAYNNSLSLSDQFSMEFIPEMNGLSGFDYYAEMTTQPTSVLAQAGDFLGGVGHSQCADSLENNNFNMPALGRKLLLESPLGSHFAVMINDEKAQALYCPSALVNNVDSKLPCIVRMGLQDYVPHSTTAIRMECTNQFGEMLSRSGSEYTTHKRLENKCKRLRGANACEDLEDDSDPKIDLCKESRAEYPAKVVKKGEKAESPKGFIHVRARRGEATDSHSLAERVRREKIRERMKRLQDLVPGCSKVTGKAQLLDEIINYIQSLQSQVELLSVKLAFVIRHCNFHVQVDGNPSQEVLSVQGNTIPVAACDTAVNHVEEGETTAEPQMAEASFSMILNE